MAMPNNSGPQQPPRGQALEEAIKDGHYARKQIFLKNRLISWSHRRRFQVGLQICAQTKPQRVLDYGCGDGTFLAMLFDSASPPSSGVGAELEEKVILDCRRRFAPFSQLAFVAVGDLGTPVHQAAFDAIFCMEVFEHVVEVESELGHLKRLLAPGGRLCISVPVETGLSLPIKQCARRLAAWRGLGDYPGSEPYTWMEFWKSVLAGRQQHIRRPIHTDASGFRSHDHKGFNWRALKARVEAFFEVEAVRTSPVTWLPALVSSQVWLICRHRRTGVEVVA